MWKVGFLNKEGGVLGWSGMWDVDVERGTLLDVESEGILDDEGGTILGCGKWGFLE